MTRIDWENITNYIESVGTTDTVFPFKKAQSSVTVTARGATANILYTIGGQSGTLTPGQSVTVTGSITTMTLRAASGRQPFYVWATEEGTEKDEESVSPDLSGIQTKVDDLEMSLAQKTKDIGISITNYPRLAGETSDSPRIQRAVNENPNKRILFPDDTYEISTMISITNQASLELSKNAVFKATAAMEYLIDWDGGGQNLFSEYSMHITGGVLDGAGISGGLRLGNIHHFLHENTWYKDCKSGLYLGKATDYKSYEGLFRNLYFRNTIGIAGSIAIEHRYKGDHHFSDIIIVDYETGIKNGGYSNRFFRIHYWCTNIIPDMSKTIAFETWGNDAIFTDCYADTSAVGFKIEAETRIINATGLHNTAYGGTAHKSIQYTNPAAKLTVIGGKFTGDGATDIFFDGTISKLCYFQNLTLNGLINTIDDNRVYYSTLSAAKKTEFLTIKKPTVNEADLNFNLLVKNVIFGTTVFNCTLKATDLVVKCANVTVAKNFNIVKEFVNNVYIYHFYANSGNQDIAFEFKDMKGIFRAPDGTQQSYNYLTSTGIFVVNEGTTGQQDNYISGTTLTIYDEESLAADTVKVGKFYLWDDGTNLRVKESPPLSLTDGMSVYRPADGSAYAAKVGSSAPSTLPDYAGQRYVDVVNKKVYTACGSASVADWILLN